MSSRAAAPIGAGSVGRGLGRGAAPGGRAARGACVPHATARRGTRPSRPRRGARAGDGKFNLGESEHDYRVPDGGVHRERPRGVWLATAAIVVEIVSPGDESMEKLPFYARQRVDEGAVRLSIPKKAARCTGSR